MGPTEGGIADPTIHVLDLGYQGLTDAIAAFLLEGPRGAVLVETGPASTFPALERGLAAFGLRIEDLAAAFVTHIHLDHAGAAGAIAQRGVPVYVHPRGARHLVNPARLLASAGKIYGDRMGPLWGETVPAPASKVFPVPDEAVVAVAGLELRAIDTPGHARHHHAWRVGDTIFAGDVAGVRLPGSRLVAVPAVPPEFDPPAWLASIARLRAEAPARLMLTHFGAVTAPIEHGERLAEELDVVVSFVTRAHEEGVERAALVADYVEFCRARVRATGATPAELARYEAANPFAMSVDGILGWLGRATGKDAAAERT